MRFVRAFAIVGLALLVLSGPVRAEEVSAMDITKEVGLGVCLATSNLFYGPGKVIWALLGTVVTPVVWTLTGFDGDVARRVFYSSVRGDYGLTIPNLTGEESFDFVGRMPGSERSRDSGSSDSTVEGF